MSVNLYKNGDLIPIAGNGGGVEVDAELSAESENPVQNKAIDAKIKELESAIAQATTALNNLKQVAKTGSYNDLTDKPTIPTSLKNPQPLVFSGGSSVSYDGSEKQTVPIPTSLPASGGNADTVGNKHASDFVAKTGDTMTGKLTVKSGTVTGYNTDTKYSSGYILVGDRVGLSSDLEGGSVWFKNPKGDWHIEMDAFANNVMRWFALYKTAEMPLEQYNSILLFNLEDQRTEIPSLLVNSFISTTGKTGSGGLRLGSIKVGDEVDINANDNEGGNINFHSKNNLNRVSIDCYENNMRLFQQRDYPDGTPSELHMIMTHDYGAKKTYHDGTNEVIIRGDVTKDGNNPSSDYTYLGGVLRAGENALLCSDPNGGKLMLTSPVTPNNHFAIDVYNDNVRLYQIKGGVYKNLANFDFDTNTASIPGLASARSILVKSEVPVATTDFVEDSTVDGYSYKADIPVEGCTYDHSPTVTFSTDDALSGNLAQVASSDEGVVTIYAKEVPKNDITIQSIVLIGETKNDEAMSGNEMPVDLHDEPIGNPEDFYLPEDIKPVQTVATKNEGGDNA